jgi:tripartite-type tricarboxylate transporter receptor subunit TctC
MPLVRRRFLALTAGSVAMPALPQVAAAQTFPSRPLRIVVGFAAGGTQDIVARLVGQALSDRLGQQFVIENKGGAGGNIAADTVVHAPADGYTLLVVGLSNVVNTSLYEKLSFDFLRDIAPVAAVVRVPGVMVVNPSLPVQTVPEFISYAKAAARPVNMATAGVGAPQHVYGELLKMMTGLNLTHVPYRGGAPAISDLLGGQVQVILNPLPETIEHIKAGRLRALAVTTAERAPPLPDVPALKEFLPGFDASSWYGIGAPKSTPVEIVTRLNTEINAAVNEPKLKARLQDLGGMVITGSPSDFGKLIADETDKWAKVIKFSGVKAE